MNLTNKQVEAFKALQENIRKVANHLDVVTTTQATVEDAKRVGEQIIAELDKFEKTEQSKLLDKLYETA